MYAVLHRQVPSCALQFTYNRVSKPDSHKIHAPFWVGRARCRTGDCPVVVKMYIDSQPVPHADVPVRAVVYGDCSHFAVDSDVPVEMQLPNRRFLSGSLRRKTADLLATTQQPATEYYLGRLAEMSDKECQAGNMTTCQTPEVLRQAVSQQKRESQLHHDVVLDVDLQRRCWLAALPGHHVSGFVQALGVFPFFTTFYTEMQVTAFIDSCKAHDGGFLHLDCTGSVVRRIPQQSAPFLYCGVMADSNIPAFEFLTTRHDAVWLGGLMQLFVRDVRACNGGRTVTVRHVVTDFSYAIIHAVLSAFNNMDFNAYVRTTYAVLSRAVTSDRLRSLTFLHLCAAHTMKALSRRLVRKESDKKKRQTTLQLFAILQRTTSLEQAFVVYKHVYIVLCSPHATTTVAASLDELISELHGDIAPADDSQPLCPIDDAGEWDAVDVRNLKKSSPFTGAFAAAIADIDVSMDNVDASANVNCSPAGFECIRDVIHVYPLWSCVLQNDVTQYASDSHTIDRSTESQWPTCATNAKVESYFKSVKHGRLAGKLRVRPRDFLMAEMTKIVGKLKERKLPKQSPRTRRVREGADAREMWKRRRQRTPAYGTKSKAEDRLCSLRSTTYDVLEHDDEEMSDTAVDDVMLLLRQHSPHIDGLEPVGLGQCQKRSATVPGSLPRFSPATRPFVQVLNVGDHWICTTNYFSLQQNEVHIFDSMFRTVSANAILQLSAILRRQTDCDSITVRVRDFDVQPHRSRLCGFYAAAAALSICNDVDPSGNRYDVDSLASCVSVAVANKCPDVIVPRQNVGASDLSVVVRPKLHCVCHSASTDHDMVQCSQCMYRYHSVCLAVTDTTDHTWLGPCCVSSSSAIRARRAELQPHEHSTFNATTRNFT